MDNTQKKRLERNLSQSASGAKPYWPRVLIGPGVETQGYIDPKLLPIDDINLGKFREEFIHHVYDRDQYIIELENRLTTMTSEALELGNQINTLRKRIEALEGFSLD